MLQASDTAVFRLDAARESRKDASAEDGLREVLLVRELLQLAGAVVDDGLRICMCRYVTRAEFDTGEITKDELEQFI